MKMPVYYYHVIAFLVGFILDCILGDPYFFPHPVKLIGKLISYLENHFLGEKEVRLPISQDASESADEEEEAPKEESDGLKGPEVWDGEITAENIIENEIYGDKFKMTAKEPFEEPEEEEAWVDEAFTGEPEEFDWSQKPVKKAALEEKPAEKEEVKAPERKKEEERLTPVAKEKREQGRSTVLIVLFCTVAITDAVFMLSYVINPILGCVIEAILTYQILAAKCLYVESMKVYKALKHGTLKDARRAVSMIVGRDTAKLDEAGVTRAAVETVAENTSDGVIAPMLYLAIGGPILGMAYKAINTMDSMIGYKNERYLDFGRAAAKLDDVVNFLPSRISAWLMIFSCHFLGRNFIASEAKRIFLRDRKKHSSPNSAQTESVCAGALGIQLAGDASYFGQVVHKPTIGDARRQIVPEDIKRANILMYGATILCLLICLALLLAVCQFVLGGTAVIKFGR